MIIFSESELKALEAFEEKHLNCYTNNNHNHENMHFIITQNWTGIGVNTSITCGCCGETIDCTDYDCW